MRPRTKMILALASFSCLAPVASGLNKTWTFAGSGNWSVASNWAGGIPVAADFAFITHADAISRDVNLDIAANVSGLFIGNTGAGTDSLTQSAAVGLTVSQERIGSAAFSRGVQTQNAGSAVFSTFLTVGDGTSSFGTYNLNAGTLQVNGSSGLYVGLQGNGVFNQNGGAVTLSSVSPLWIGYGGTDNALGTGNGTYTLSSGSLTSLNSEYIGYYGLGTFIQNGGTHTVGTALTPASVTIAFGTNCAGNLRITNGIFTVYGSETIGSSSTGTVTQSGGTHTIGSNALQQTLSVGSVNQLGIYNLSGNAALTVYGKELVGYNSFGSFSQSGGTNTVGSAAVGGSLEIGSGAVFASQGTYNLSGGDLLVNGSEIVGYGTNTQPGSGTFIQSGGTNTVGSAITSRNLNIGRNGTSAGSGTYLLSGGSATVYGSTYVGGSEFGAGGTGVLNISGGTMTVNNILRTYAGGTVILGGGQLTVGTLDSSGNPARFVWNSGTFNLVNSYSLVASGLLGSPNLTALKKLNISNLTSGDGTATITLNGGIFSTGALSNAALLQFNSGTFRLTASPLTIGAGGLFGGTVQLNSSQRIEVPGAFVSTDSDALLSLAGGSLYTPFGVINNGQIQLSGATAQLLGGGLYNYGTVSGSGRVSSDLNNNVGALVRASGTDWLQFTGPSGNTNNGQITALNGAEIDFSAFVSNAATGIISARGVLNFAGGLANAGKLQASGGFTDVFGAISNTGTITVTGGNTSTFYGSMDTMAGAITVNTASTVVFLGDVLGQSRITGPGLKDFEAAASGGPLATVVGSTIVGSSGQVKTTYFNENNLQVLGSAKVLLNGTSASLSKLNTLSISGGTLDLTNNNLIVRATPLATIAGYIASAYNLGDWAGEGLTSSSAQASLATAHPTALGYATASSINANVFDGQPVNGTDVLVRYTYVGDSNLDGKVNTLDFNYLAGNFGQAGKNWAQGDYNFDGLVNSIDFNALVTNYGLTPPISASLGQVVPEPGMISLAALAMGTLFRIRQRQRGTYI